jgi:integrase
LIDYEIRHGKFDYLHFFPHGSKSNYFRRPSGDVLFSDWWAQWLKEKSLRPNTARGWNSAWRIHLMPHFGHYHISEVTESEILIFRKSLETKDLKASTINDKIIKPLCMSLFRAYKRGMITQYPCDQIERLKEDPVDIAPFTVDELTHLLDTLKSKRPADHDMLYFWSRTGLRPGELIVLKWPRIDFYNQKALIRETRLPSGTEGPPKTKHSIRDVDLRPKVADALKRQYERTGLVDAHVFMTGANKPFSDAFLRKRFRFLLKLSGLAYRPPKQMRHTFATLHLAAGEHISWVSRTLGHGSAEVTWKRYNRFLPNFTREDGSAFEAMMNGKKKGFRFGHNVPKQKENPIK